MRMFDLQSSCVNIFAQLRWLVVGLVFTKMFTHHSVPVLRFGLDVSLFGHLFVFRTFVPAVCAAVVVNFRSRWVFWIGDSFSDTSAIMISDRCPLKL